MNNFFYFRLTSGVLLTLLAAGVEAERFSPLTGAVNGRAPVAKATISGTAVVGNMLTANSGFSDPDVDTEDGTTYSWDIGPLNLGTSATLAVPPLAGANTITLSVTPKTNMAITDPAVGTVSTKEVVVPPDLGKFIKPDNTLRTWSQADAYCTDLGTGARLPTRDELMNLFLSATSSTADQQANSEMCTVHNWPLGDQCDGSNFYYWSSTSNDAGSHYNVDLQNGSPGSYIGNGTVHVACVR